ncbi:family 78 glycoside hydrolase catalytic domain [Paenibacillus sp.]|uniref:family 78 glycoside hydrolase catalytic domain n=1 Tax=Paenibacillus sp. TaxID=58172 RepID=UPI002810B675|nr:family 78 glycoside hydrolase catalytic domain [Paenibacillus sp.]
MFAVKDLRCEYKKNPLGIDVACPRISWRLETDERAILQSAYRIQVSDQVSFADMLWDSGKVISDISVHVELTGLPVYSCKRYYYRIQVWNQREETTGWSETAFWETGLMSDKEWTASWISEPRDTSASGEVCPMLRKAFALGGAVREARIYATALGVYELTLNGQKVGDRFFTPGWTSYRHRIQYQTYDVTEQLQQGDNVIGAVLGKGWYMSEIGWGDPKYGDRLALLLQLHVLLENGEKFVLVSDATWKVSESPIRMSEIYHGETYDARLEQPGWGEAGFDDRHWRKADILIQTKETLVADESDPVQRVLTVRPVEILTAPNGDRIIDFGQNMVGWVNFTVKGNAGDEVVLRHAEVLDREGNLYTENLRRAKQTVRYVLKGDGDETFEPRFSFQGFRYVMIEGFPETVTLDDFRGMVLHSNMEETGFFECSEPLINRLYQNIEWSLRGNFLDVPTDCPQRDERLGWTGDAQVFIRTAAYLRNVNPFFTKWLRDLRADQAADGGVPYVVPNVMEQTAFSSAGWGDAAVICPWTLFLYYGDVRILEEQYESMKAWVEYMRSDGEDEHLWNTGIHFGDWLASDGRPGSYSGGTDKDIIATAFYGYSVSILQKAAAVLNRKEDEAVYRLLYDHIVDAFHKEFVTTTGRLAVPTQTAHVLALMFGLLRGDAKKRAVRKLSELVEESGYHVTTGFLGTPYINHVLADNGNAEAAYRLLLQKESPSWLYQIGQGASTVWEHWDGIRKDGSFRNPEMNSFNHYAYGAIGDWLFRCVAGIEPDEENPGYKKIKIHPHIPQDGLTWATGRVNTVYGEVRSAWRKQPDGTIELQAAIPPNTTADIVLRGAGWQGMSGPGGAEHREEGVIDVAETDDGYLVTVGSGTYSFVRH